MDFYHNNTNDTFDSADHTDEYYVNDNQQTFGNHHDDTDEGNNSDTDEASESELSGRNGRKHGNGTDPVVPITHPNQNRTNSTSEPIEIKEQMYQDKLASLKKQMDELKNHFHPEYIRRVKKLEYQYNERIRLNDIYRDYLIECVDRDYNMEKKAAIKEYEEKKTDLKENLLTDFEEKRKTIEAERYSMELMCDSAEVKPTVTRKLRRRPNDPLPVAAEKRRKPPSGQLIYLLDERDIDMDLKIIVRGKQLPATTTIRSNQTSPAHNQNPNQSNPLTPNPVPLPPLTSQIVGGPTQTGSNGLSPPGHQSPKSDSLYASSQMVETKIEDGKLLYERRWFHRGQPVYVEGKDVVKFSATISAIGNDVIWVKKLSDNNKVKIHTSQLAKGKIAIKRRAN